MIIDNIKCLSVKAVNEYLSYKINNDVNLKNIFIKAEVSNAKISGGILYFSLKDNDSEIDCLMFASDLAKLKFKVEDGMKVTAYGSVQGYAKRGRYSFIAKELEQDGIGKLYQDYLLLKEKLEKEGLFEESRKKPIPKFPETIGVVTSNTGEAINDIKTTINKRFPLANILLYKATVQGDTAPQSIITSIKNAIEDNLCDVLIIGRGGGSFEDLNCFNDEALARVIASCPIPTISAVGHEGDYTICDFVSDLRAPTPTGAGMLATPSKQELLERIESINNTLNNYLLKALDNYQTSITNIGKSLDLLSPIAKVDNLEKELERYIKRLDLLKLDSSIDKHIEDINNLLISMGKTFNDLIDKSNTSVNKDIDKLILLNPLTILSKGYSVVYDNDKIVSSVSQVNDNDELKIKVSDGEFRAIAKK